MTPKEQGQLLDRYLHGLLSEQECERVEQLLLDDPDAAAQLAILSAVDCMLIQLGRQEDLAADSRITEILAIASPQPLPEPDPLAPKNKSRTDIAEIRQRAERQLEAFLEQQRRDRVAQESRESGWDLSDMASDVVGMLRSFTRTGLKAAKAAVVCSLTIAVVLMISLYVRATRPVAVLADSADAKWDNPMVDGAELRRGWLTLEQGYARIVFKKGAEVILQAPSSLQLQTSNKMFLEEGRITARISASARGFAVVTPGSSVVDYGTEFGMLARTNEDCEVHVFDGEVALESSGKRGSPKRYESLTQGASAMVDQTGRIETGKLADRPRLFTRKMPVAGGFAVPGKRLDLADIVGGGNGFGTGAVGGGSAAGAMGTVNPITGNPNDPTRPTGQPAGRDYDNQHHECSNQYTRTQGLAYVDGVFVPDGGKGLSVVSSAGHVFRECPDTDGRIKWNIINGWRYRDLADPTRNNDRLTRAHGISMHANAGLTFDLDAMRRDLSGIEIHSFLSHAGVPVTYEPQTTKIDVWILVDGQVRFVQRAVRFPEEFDIQVALHAQDRFLTLAVTDSASPDPAQASSGVDWCFWQEPTLELELTAGNRRPGGR